MKRGDWIYNKAQQRAGIVREVLDDEKRGLMIVAAYPAPKVQYVMGGKASRPAPVVEVLMTTEMVVIPLAGMFPKNALLASVRVYFGTKEERTMWNAWNEARKVKEELRKAL